MTDEIDQGHGSWRPHLVLKVLALVYFLILYVPGITGQYTYFIDELSHIGLVLLLFFVGLEFSLTKLKKTKTPATRKSSHDVGPPGRMSSINMPRKIKVPVRMMAVIARLTVATR